MHEELISETILDSKEVGKLEILIGGGRKGFIKSKQRIHK